MTHNDSTGTDTNAIVFLMQWYQSQCNGDWEHQNGIRIRTIDNPGWSIDIDLEGTPLAGLVAAPALTERTEEDWTFFEVKEGLFRARGGPGNLLELIAHFSALVRDNTG